MKHLFKHAVLLCVASILMSAPAFALTCDIGEFTFKNMSTHKYECRQPTPDEGWAMLLKGNSQFVHNNNGRIEAYSNKKQRELLAGTAGQKPYAIVLTCSDSRVPPEILFNKALGEIFVVRVAGNLVDPHELGSIDYAVEHLGANLIVVLGHSSCGAVKSTYQYYPTHLDAETPVATNPTKNIASLTESIYPAVDMVITDPVLSPNGKVVVPVSTDPGYQQALAEQAAQLDECIVENIRMVGESLEVKSAIVKEAKEGLLEYSKDPERFKKNPLKIKYAKYNLATGVVEDLTPLPAAAVK